ncbi:MAG: hypothetical protein D6714_08830 [Bacteroidetes bacterium]|nr:MAG: hypothetical protein D6714_08830 [Bacteroidota bacterium]
MANSIQNTQAMIVRKFKPGDRVEHRLGGPVMEVIRYEKERDPLAGEVISDHDVFCVWYEDGERKTGVFDQRTLIKSSKSTGLFKT